MTKSLDKIELMCYFYAMDKSSSRVAQINRSARTSGQDNGCELAPSCLDCPFPACVKEDMGGGKRWLKSLRDRQIVHLRRTTNISIVELGRRFKVNKRTIYRALRQSKILSSVLPRGKDGVLSLESKDLRPRTPAFFERTALS